MDNTVIIAYNRHIQFCMCLLFCRNLRSIIRQKMLTKKRANGIIIKKRGDDYMVIKELNILKKKLEDQVLKNDPYDKIYETSVKIDDLLIKYYENIGNLKKESLDSDIKKNLSC